VPSLKVAVWRSHDQPWCYAYVVIGGNGEVLANHRCVHDDYGNLMPVADLIRKTT
jgi:hypothetical protein